MQEEILSLMSILSTAESAALSLLKTQIEVDSDASSNADSSTVNLQKLAQGLYLSRRSRDNFFNCELFAEPAWDMLLAAYYLGPPNRELSVTGLCYASACPPTTALRWLGRLSKAGLIVRYRSQADRRVFFVALTIKARERFEAYLVSIGRRYVSSQAHNSIANA